MLRKLIIPIMFSLVFPTVALAFDEVESSACKVYWGKDAEVTVSGTYRLVGTARLLLEDDGSLWYLNIPSGQYNPLLKDGNKITVTGIHRKLGFTDWMVINGVPDVAYDGYRGHIYVLEINGKEVYLRELRGKFKLVQDKSQKVKDQLIIEGEDGRWYGGSLDRRLEGKEVNIIVLQGPFPRYNGYIAGKEVYGPNDFILDKTWETPNCKDVRKWIEERLSSGNISGNYHVTPYGMDGEGYPELYLSRHLDLWKRLAQERKVWGIFPNDGILRSGTNIYAAVHGNRIVVDWAFMKKKTDASKIKVFVRGKGFIESDTEPYIKNDRVMVPYRAVAEALGALVDYDWKTKTVTLKKSGKTVLLTIGENVMLVDGVSVTLDAAPELLKNRTHVPLRAIAEALGADVEWEDLERFVVVR